MGGGGNRETEPGKRVGCTIWLPREVGEGGEMLHHTYIYRNTFVCA